MPFSPGMKMCVVVCLDKMQSKVLPYIIRTNTIFVLEQKNIPLGIRSYKDEESKQYPESFSSDNFRSYQEILQFHSLLSKPPFFVLV